MKTRAAAAPTLPVRQMLHVRTGQSQMLHWPAGTVITPLRGGVWLSETPRWLGGQLLRPRCRVEAHATFVLPDAGWVVLWAESDAVLQVVRVNPAVPTVVQPAWAFIAAIWRRACRAFARGPARLA